MTGCERYFGVGDVGWVAAGALQGVSVRTGGFASQAPCAQKQGPRGLLDPPLPLFSDGFYLAYGPFKEKPTCLDYFSEGKNVYPLQLKVKPPGENEYYCYYPYLWSSKSQTFANWRRGPETVLLQMSREGTVPIKNW